MEVATGWAHTAFPVDDGSRVGEARRHAAGLADQLAWSEVDAGKLALVVTELATNLLRHATGGRLLLAARPDLDQVEVLALDRGPGIPDVARSLGDGFSTGGTPGTGLGAVRRLARDFDVYSTVPGGTVVLARVQGAAAQARSRAAAVQFGVVALAAPGETLNGDGWMACTEGSRVALLLADGLGHGPQAHDASKAAIEVFRQRPFADLRELLREAHGQLRTTRGAAVTCLQLDAGNGAIRAAGAGNVVCRILSGVSDRSVMSQHGTIGVQIRTVEELRHEWPPHAMVVLHTDGIETRWDGRELVPVLGRDPSLAAALLLRDHCRGRDDATVVVLRRST